MPDWQSTTEVLRDADIFIKLMHALFGVYVWEWFISAPFDWQFLTLKKKFKWPMIFYFLNRYILLLALIGIIIGYDNTTQVNCQALYTFIQICGNAAAGLASINLSLRTIAVYSNSKYIIAFLVLVILGHWSLILQGTILTAVWDPTSNSCQITKTNTTILGAIWIYSMGFDLVVLFLNAYKLVGRRSKDGAIAASRIGKMLFNDGLVYFLVAFLSNLIATVFILLNLNAVMSIIFNVPAVIASTIVACRVVRRLSNFANQGPEMFSGSNTHSTGQYRVNPVAIATSGGRAGTASRKPTTHGVHVQMETFTRTEEFDTHSPTQDYLRYAPAEVQLESGMKQDRDSETDFEEVKAVDAF